MILKYVFDRIVAFVGLLLLLPLLAVVAVLVKVKMPDGPVFFVQRRVGKDGMLFKCHKFRTMKVDHCGTSVSVAGESRVTLFGVVLRRYKLDELPELWDVLVGNMSFVGPRPDVPGYADMLQGTDKVVLRLRPGITGPATMKYRHEEELIAEYVAKVRGGVDVVPIPADNVTMTDEQLAVWYNDNVIYPDKVRLNKYYYEHYSFWVDIKIIIATVFGKRIEYNKEII